MEQSNFISLIKKQSDKLVEAWNIKNEKDVLSIMSDMQLITGIYFCLYTEEVTVFEIAELKEGHKFYELIGLARARFDCKKKLESDDLTDEVRQDTEELLSFINTKLDELPCPEL